MYILILNPKIYTSISTVIKNYGLYNSEKKIRCAVCLGDLGNKGLSNMNEGSPANKKEPSPAKRNKGSLANRNEGFQANSNEGSPANRNEGSPVNSDEGSPANRSEVCPGYRNEGSPANRNEAYPAIRNQTDYRTISATPLLDDFRFWSKLVLDYWAKETKQMTIIDNLKVFYHGPEDRLVVITLKYQIKTRQNSTLHNSELLLSKTCI